MAAFPVAFSVDGLNHGRLIDDDTVGGPGFDYYTYPSTQGFPANSTAVSGTLRGMGAGYSSFNPGGCPTECGSYGGHATAGVGYQALSAINCSTAIGVGPVGEGQINTMGLPTGTYTLVLVPGHGNNLLNGNFACATTDPGAFAVLPDAVVGSQRMFVVLAGPLGMRAIVAHKIYYNNCAYDGNTATAATAAQESAAIATDKSVLLPGQTATLANLINYSRGINGLMIDITPGGFGCGSSSSLDPIAIANALSFMVGNGNPMASFVPVAITPSVKVFPGAGTDGSDRVVITLPDQPITSPPLNTKWLRVKLAASGAPGLSMDDVLYVGWAKGEAGSVGGGFALVNTTDVNAIKTNPHGSLNPTVLADATDNNKDGRVNIVDVNNALLSQTNSLRGLLLITAP